MKGINWGFIGAIGFCVVVWGIAGGLVFTGLEIIELLKGL